MLCDQSKTGFYPNSFQSECAPKTCRVSTLQINTQQGKRIYVLAIINAVVTEVDHGESVLSKTGQSQAHSMLPFMSQLWSDIIMRIENRSLGREHVWQA